MATWQGNFGRNFLGTDNKLGEDVVYLKGSHMAHFKNFIVSFLLLQKSYFYTLFSQTSTHKSPNMAQELVSMVNFTLGHHWRRHWNSTGLEATPSGPSQHSITHTHHHGNTSNTQQPQQLHNSHYTHALCRTTT
jgi:hypothetical protein